MATLMRLVLSSGASATPELLWTAGVCWAMETMESLMVNEGPLVVFEQMVYKSASILILSAACVFIGLYSTAGVSGFPSLGVDYRVKIVIRGDISLTPTVRYFGTHI